MILSIIVLARLIGLSTAMNLFNIALLVTPVPMTRATTHNKNPLWTPPPSLYLLFALGSFAMVATTPYTKTAQSAHTIFRLVYYAAPLALALLPDLLPARLGKTYSSTEQVRSAQSKIFSTLALLSLALHLKTSVTAVFDNAPTTYTRNNFVWNTHGEERHALDKLHVALAHVLGVLNEHPAVSAVGWDVLLSALSACAWAFVHGVDVDGMLKCSVVPWHKSPADEATVVKMEGSGAPNVVRPSVSSVLKRAAERPREDEIVVDDAVAPVKRGRGRPKKNSTPVSKSASSAVADVGASMRRSMRRQTASPALDLDSDEQDEDDDETYVPPAGVARQVADIGTDAHESDLAEESEAGALGWGMFVVGGLGMLTAGVFGAEACA